MTLPLQSKVPRCDAAKLCTTACVALKETVKIPPLHEVEVNGTFTGELEPGPWLIESSGVPKKTVHVANAIVIPRNGMVPVRLMNSSCEPVTVYHGDLIARMELLKSSEGVTVGCFSTEESMQSTDTHTPQITPEKEKKLWEIVQGMGAELSSQERKRVFDLLVKYQAIFPQKGEIGKTKVLQHKIRTGDAPPVRQRPRRTHFYQREESRKCCRRC